MFTTWAKIQWQILVFIALLIVQSFHSSFMSAAVADEVTDWSQRFANAALTSDPTSMMNLIKEVGDTRFNMSLLSRVNYRFFQTSKQ